VVNSKASALHSGFGLIKTTASHWMEDNALRLSAALAYYSIFSIAPLLVLAVGLAGMFLGADAVRGHLADELKDLIGWQAAQTVEAMIKSTSHPTQSFMATIVGLVTMLLGASGVFGQLKDALNTIWEVRIKPGVGIKAFVMDRILSFGMVIVIGFLLLVSFMLTAVLSAFSHWIAAILKLPEWLWGGAALLVSFATITLLFALIFKVLPDVKIPWRHVWIGASVTALFFEFGKFGLAYYLGKESTVSSFGSAGSVVLLLLWVYYASCILLFGAEFTKVYATAHGGRLQPTELATPVTSEARLQQGLEAREPVASPARESLAAIFPAPPEQFEHTNSKFPTNVKETEEYLCQHPVSSMLLALGCGFTAGLISRQRNPREQRPGQQMREGSHLLRAALVVLAARFHKQVLRTLRESLPGAWRKMRPRILGR
jgi:membrane protein